MQLFFLRLESIDDEPPGPHGVSEVNSSIGVPRMSMHQVTLLLLFLVLPQAVAFGGRVLIKLGGFGACLTSGLTFFAVSLIALVHLLANPPVNAADPHCGQWLAGLPTVFVLGSLFHAIFTAGILAGLFAVDTIRWWWAHGSTYLAEKSGNSPE